MTSGLYGEYKNLIRNEMTLVLGLSESV